MKYLLFTTFLIFNFYALTAQSPDNIFCSSNADYVNPETKKINYKVEVSEFCVEVMNESKIILTIDDTHQMINVLETEILDVTSTGEKVYKAISQVGFDRFEIFYIDYGPNKLNTFMVHIYNRYVENFDTPMIIQYKGLTKKL